MVCKIDHIGIAVKNVVESAEKFNRLFSLELSGINSVERQKVKIIKAKIGDTDLEFLEGTSVDSPVSKFIEKQGEGIHHIALKLENIQETEKSLKENGIKLVFNKYQIGEGGKKINFIHPKEMNGILIEICE